LRFQYVQRKSVGDRLPRWHRKRFTSVGELIDDKFELSQVRIFDLATSTNAPSHELRGHRQRVFNTVWSPLLPHTLASGSDDKTIRVWDTTTQTSVVFEGHHDRVRALVWNQEVSTNRLLIEDVSLFIIHPIDPVPVNVRVVGFHDPGLGYTYCYLHQRRTGPSI
jgi:WD40 repeat protein